MSQAGDTPQVIRPLQFPEASVSIIEVAASSSID